MVNLSKFPSGHHTTMMIDINAFYHVHCATTNCIELDWIGLDWIVFFCHQLWMWTELLRMKNEQTRQWHFFHDQITPHFNWFNRSN